VPVLIVQNKVVIHSTQVQQIIIQREIHGIVQTIVHQLVEATAVTAVTAVAVTVVVVVQMLT